MPTVNEQIIPVECVAIGKEVHKILYGMLFTPQTTQNTRTPMYLYMYIVGVQYKNFLLALFGYSYTIVLWVRFLSPINSNELGNNEKKNKHVKKD